MVGITVDVQLACDDAGIPDEATMQGWIEDAVAGSGRVPGPGAEISPNQEATIDAVANLMGSITELAREVGKRVQFNATKTQFIYKVISELEKRSAAKGT